MPKTKLHPVKSTKTVQVPLNRVQALHAASAAMLDLAEEILEENGQYTDEFLASLAEAEADIKAGRVYTAESIDDLLRKKG